MDDAFVPVAEVVKAVGLKGEVKLYPFIDWYEPLLDADVLIWAEGDAVEIDHWRVHSGGYVIKTPRADDRSGAEALIGETFGFLRSRYADPDFPRPERGLPFRWQGRPVHTTEGETLGIVTEVRRYAAQYTLVVPRDGREVLIPAVPAILVAEEGLDGPLTVALPEGLLDVAQG